MKTIIFLGLISLSINACSDSFIPYPHCYKPNKPLLYSPPYYSQRYNKEVIEYLQCLNIFISQQQEAINMHKVSIQQAKELLAKQQ